MTSPAQIRLAALVFIAVFAFMPRSKAADEAGKVCIQRISMDARWDANDTGAKEASKFTVQIDDLPAIYVSTNSSGVFTNLSLAKKHSVKVKLDDKRLTSFGFTFRKRGDHLRLWYNPFYGTWSLSDVRGGEKCACPTAEPSNRSSALISSDIRSIASTLTTPSYRITVEVRCPEGHVTCEDVRYVGVSRKSGKSITLTGRTVHTTGADGVTPSRFLGYTFENGSTTYFLSEDGELRITRGATVLVEEKGAWKW